MKDAEGFDAFYAAGNKRVLHQMYAMTGNLSDAQELTQEAYARAWQRWSTVETYDDPEAWVRTVAWRLAASRWRKAKNGVAAMLRHGPPDHTPEPSVDNVALVAALREIPEAAAASHRPAPPRRPVGRRGRPRGGSTRGHGQGAPVARPGRPRLAPGRQHARGGEPPCLSTTTP